MRTTSAPRAPRASARSGWWPGVGHWLVESVQRRDYPVVQGGVLLIATLVMLVNLGVDLTYGFLNPRIRR